jgi:hypothetical protein
VLWAAKSPLQTLVKMTMLPIDPLLLLFDSFASLTPLGQCNSI